MKSLPPVLALLSITLFVTACTTNTALTPKRAEIRGSEFNSERAGSLIMYEFHTVVKPAADLADPESLMRNNHKLFCGPAMLPMLEPGWRKEWNIFKTDNSLDAGFSFIYRCKSYLQLQRSKPHLWSELPEPGRPNLRIQTGL